MEEALERRTKTQVRTERRRLREAEEDVFEGQKYGRRRRRIDMSVSSWGGGEGGVN